MTVLPMSTSIVPEETRKRWRTRTYRQNMQKLANLLELREIAENAEAEGQRVLMQLYDIAAEDWSCHPDTIRADLATVRKYSPDKLVYWIKNGIAFHHLELANAKAQLKKMTPADVLNFAIEHGDENGRPMTVNKMYQFLTGEKNYTPAFSANSMLAKLGKFPDILGWDEVKKVKFYNLLDEMRALLT